MAFDKNPRYLTKLLAKHLCRGICKNAEGEEYPVSFCAWISPEEKIKIRDKLLYGGE